MKLLRYIFFTVICTIAATTLYAQNKNFVDMKEFDDNSFKDAMPTVIKDSSILFQHLIGIKYGYSINGIAFNQQIRTKSIENPINFGIYYTYLHSLWESMPYFGFQTGLEYTSFGSKVLFGDEDSPDQTEIEYYYNSYVLPITVQFRTDIKMMRLMVNAGSYAYNICSEYNGKEVPATTNLYGCGLTAGGGVAVKLHPIELHLECTYRYSLSNFFNPKIYSETYWTYAHSTQLQFSVGLFYNFTRKKK